MVADIFVRVVNRFAKVIGRLIVKVTDTLIVTADRLVMLVVAIKPQQFLKANNLDNLLVAIFTVKATAKDNFVIEQLDSMTTTGFTVEDMTEAALSAAS